ncbi:MAG: hypothetical protein Q9182_006004 [Xanthomendoza sp. 2 TL-2023]
MTTHLLVAARMADVSRWTSKSTSLVSIREGRIRSVPIRIMPRLQKPRQSSITQLRYAAGRNQVTARRDNIKGVGTLLIPLALLQEYNAADDHLRSRLPPVITAAFSLLPHLLAAQIMTQNSLLAQCYTVLHEYCGEARFPSPPPGMSDIISTWDQAFRPIQKDVETGFAFLSNGKAVRQHMKQPDANQGHSLSGLNIRNGYAQRRSSSQSSHLKTSAPLAIGAPPASSPPSSPDPNAISTRPRISSIPSQTSLSLATPNYTSLDGPSPSPGDLLSSYALVGPRPDYFARNRQPSTSSLASIAAGKKKPPPPPPKRLPSIQREPWVIALYDFAGQGQGDLVFGEGDLIRVLKKTDSTDDWWEGELKGIQGSFPANYCRLI